MESSTQSREAEMPSALQVADIKAALLQRTIPTITTWNRLEGRPRSQSFERALQAEVRDALWMLTKQWQMGEFRGDDAGSPVFAKLLMQKTRLTKYQPAGGKVEPFDSATPLEAKVERRPIPLHRQGRILSLDLRLVMARQWFSLIAGLPRDYRLNYIAAYPIAKPDPKQKSNADVCSHPEAFDTFQAFATRAMDGGAFYEFLSSDPSHKPFDGVAGINPLDQGDLITAAQKFLAWAARFLTQPSLDDNAWVPEKLEYQFATSAPMPDGTEKVYVAEEYYAGRLDWYSLDEDESIAALDPVPNSNETGFKPDTPFTTIPVPVSFSGMPNTRWWAFEEKKTNFGDIDASTTDLAKLLFMEFALVYSNDWFVVPSTLPAGTLVKIQGLAVTNVFGERYWIEAAGKGVDKDWGRWGMFTINVRNAPAGAAADTTLLLLPTLAKSQVGPPVEEVYLVRDEVANMAWGVERTVALPTGVGRMGSEVATQTVTYLQDLITAGHPPPPPLLAAAVRYQVMNTVPENWIPFIPVHVPGNNRQIQLQRAAMPRLLVGAPPPAEKVQPLTNLLREGLDLPTAKTYFIHEEEVPRAGVRATQYYSRTRWTAGEVFVWFRAQKQTGRGEATSGLGFDRLVDQNSKEA
jgi:hypothetical protein